MFIVRQVISMIPYMITSYTTPTLEGNIALLATTIAKGGLAVVPCHGRGATSH